MSSCFTSLQYLCKYIVCLLIWNYECSCPSWIYISNLFLLLWIFLYIIYRTFPPSVSRKLRSIWALLAFSLRSMCLSNEEYANVNKNRLEKALDSFYYLWCNHFGDWNATYYVHMVSHLVKMREATGEPLPALSALPYEASYSVLRSCFSWSRNPTKGILSAIHRKQLGHKW